MGDHAFVPQGTKGVKFMMLRQEHYERATTVFVTDDFDHLSVVHAIDARVPADLGIDLIQRRIHWLTIPEFVHDLMGWYRTHSRPAALDGALVGDRFHLLAGFCGLAPRDERGSRAMD